MPSAFGISTQYSPQELVLRTRLKYKQYFRAPFGSYCEVHEDNQPTNSMASHTTPAICCGPTGNLQGSYFFFSLVTGLLIKHRKWSELPVPNAVIERVAYFADKAGSPPGIVFSSQHCHHMIGLTTISLAPMTPPWQYIPTSVPIFRECNWLAI